MKGTTKRGKGATTSSNREVRKLFDRLVGLHDRIAEALNDTLSLKADLRTRLKTLPARSVETEDLDILIGNLTFMGHLLRKRIVGDDRKTKTA
jgi:hypothetical protein